MDSQEKHAIVASRAEFSLLEDGFKSISTVQPYCHDNRNPIFCHPPTTHKMNLWAESAPFELEMLHSSSVFCLHFNSQSTRQLSSKSTPKSLLHSIIFQPSATQSGSNCGTREKNATQIVYNIQKDMKKSRILFHRDFTFSKR